MPRTRLTVALLAAGPAAMAGPAHADTFDVSGGIRIELGKGWSGRTMINPAMNFPGMKDMLEEATETRLRTGDAGILISYMKFKTDKPANETEMDDAANVKSAAMRVYGSQAEEADPQATVRKAEGVVRAFVTLHPKSGNRFMVASGYPGGCVTVGTIRKGVAIHNVSIASENCEGAAHQEALAALFGQAG